jgi:hypothetical protein
MSLVPLKPFNAPSLKRLFPFFSALRQKAFLRCASAIFLTLSELMRGKVTADAALGGGDLVGGVCGAAMRGDDWEVTRHRLLASLQPIRAEQISYRWFCCYLLQNRPWGR